MSSVANKKDNELPPLLKPPLVEAIFEVRWELQGDQQTGRYRDPAYPMLYGRLYERIKRDYPVVEDLPSVQVHPEASPYTVRHRLRREKDGWPILQVGPGIITFNEEKEYSWNSFKGQITKLLPSVAELYPTGVMPLNYVKTEVRFINAIPFDPSKENPLSFLSDQLHMKVEVDQDVFLKSKVVDRPDALSVNLAFPVQKPGGHLLLSINLGEANEKPAFIIQTVIQSIGEMSPQDLSEFEEWLEEAHEVAKNCFATLCRGELMRQFSSL